MLDKPLSEKGLVFLRVSATQTWENFFLMTNSIKENDNKNKIVGLIGPRAKAHVCVYQYNCECH